MLCPLGAFIVNYLRTSIVIKHIESSDIVCSSGQCSAAADRFESHKDDSNNLCDSFYEHICGNYMKEVDIPSHLDYIDVVYERKIEIFKIILNYFENSCDKKESPSKVDFQRIRSFYESCDRETILPTAFYEQLTEELKFVGFTLTPPFFKVPLQATLSPAKILAQFHSTSVGEAGFLFEVSVKNMNFGKVIHFGEARNSLLLETKFTSGLNEALSDYIRGVSSILWKNTGQTSELEKSGVVEQQIRGVADFLIKLIQIQEKSHPEDTKNSPMTVFDLQQWTTNQLNGGEIKINWIEFFETLYQDGRISPLIQSNKSIVIVKNKTQFENILELLKNTKAEVFTAAMWWYKVQSLEEYFPEPLEQYRQSYEQRAHRLSRAPRTERCFDWILTHFGLFVNHLLATEPQSIRIRENVSKMTENILQTLAISLYRTACTWADEATIERAIAKLSKMNIHVGFTDSLLDSKFVETAYDKVKIFEGRFIQTLSTLFREKKRNNFLEIFSDHSYVFNENEVKVDFAYHQHFNALEIPIAILGPPFYDHGIEALNYGSFGTHLSHVVWYALDIKGRKFNENGAPEYWWSPATTTKFEKFIHRFQVINNDCIKPLNACVDGKRTLVANMADWTGFKIGMRAYRATFESGGKEMRLPKFTDFSAEKLFTVAFANSFCIKARPNFLLNQIKNESTPPNIARVNAVFKNSKLFSKLWGCKQAEVANPQQKYNFWP